ncbi:ABC exporter membrane fusion protein [Nostoc sp. TCL26-01]|uniref:ABC exporter membrane fusion protein n=1 Tax=Nostoc sp. TCL26-01 TaxID=2576904 RepID=UPI0015B7A027|nr:ABC exporter membrane fusion protein [Nostoc sp. TCL26-01]QLE59070.1 HlyD family efflux transporter periplasmic adaptor subunit [Nostoc sp. TCL26-01]
MAVNKERQLFIKPQSRWWIVLAASLTFATGLISFYSLTSNKPRPQVPTTANSPKAAPVKVAVTALGRLQPEGEITTLSAPSSTNGVRVEKLLVKEGDEVTAGQVLAYLEDYDRATAALQQSLDKLQIAKVKLAQVKAGAKSGDIDAQKATVANLQSQLTGEIATQQAIINRVQAEVDNAQAESDRYQKLFQEGAVSASVSDAKALQLKTAQQQLTEAKASLSRTQNTLANQIKEAKARLNSVKEVRDVDVDLAQMEVKSAVTAIKQAQADQALSYIKAPIDGKILKIHAKTGEVIPSNGFADIGKTSQMYVIAEVYQTDIQNVRVGQKATITSTAFSGKLQGTVREIGWQVDKQSIFSLNPRSDTDRRIIEVKVSIDKPADSEKVSRLTNLQVDVAIQM